MSERTTGTPRTFKEVWAEKEAAGYQYGHDALENVEFGFELAVKEYAFLTTQRDEAWQLGLDQIKASDAYKEVLIAEKSEAYRRAEAAEAQRDELQRVHQATNGPRKWRLGKLTRFDDFGLAFIEADGQSYCFTFDKLQGYRGETPREVGLIVGRLMPILTEDGKVLYVITDGSLKCPKDDCEVFATAFTKCNRTDCPHGYAIDVTAALLTNEAELHAELDELQRALIESNLGREKWQLRAQYAEARCASLNELEVELRAELDAAKRVLKTLRAWDMLNPGDSYDKASDAPWARKIIDDALAAKSTEDSSVGIRPTWITSRPICCDRTGAACWDCPRRKLDTTKSTEQKVEE